MIMMMVMTMMMMMPMQYFDGSCVLLVWVQPRPASPRLLVLINRCISNWIAPIDDENGGDENDEMDYFRARMWNWPNTTSWWLKWWQWWLSWWFRVKLTYNQLMKKMMTMTTMMMWNWPIDDENFRARVKLTLPPVLREEEDFQFPLIVNMWGYFFNVHDRIENIKQQWKWKYKKLVHILHISIYMCVYLQIWGTRHSGCFWTVGYWLGRLSG